MLSGVFTGTLYIIACSGMRGFHSAVNDIQDALVDMLDFGTSSFFLSSS
jgi:hypothetical protein